MTFDIELLTQILEEQRKTNDLLKRIIDMQKPMEIKEIKPKVTRQRRKAQ